MDNTQLAKEIIAEGAMMDDRRIIAIANAMFSFGSILLAMLLVLFSVVEWFYAEAM